MSAICVATPGVWKHPLEYSWTVWQHIMPYLSLEELSVLSEVEYMFILVEVYLSSGKLTLDGADLRAKKNLDFYKHIGRAATQLSLEDTLETDIVPVLRCFPHLKTLTLRRALIWQNVIRGFPFKLRKLTLDRCRIKKEFLQKWCTALSETLESVELISVPEDTAEMLIGDVPHLRIQSMSITFDIVSPRLRTLELKDTEMSPKHVFKCPSIEYFKYEGGNIKDLNSTLASVVANSANALFRVVLSYCDKLTVDCLLDCPNLKHLTIHTPIEDQLDWAYITRLGSGLSTLKCTFTSGPIDALPNELLARIAGFLDAEDCIALSHVNRRLRSIIFEHVYPTVEMHLATDFKRYPLDSRPYIYIEMGRRVQKLSVRGSGKTEIFNKIAFPKLTSFKVDKVIVGLAKKIPDGLKVLHVTNKIRSSDAGFNHFLARMYPSITDWTCMISSFPNQFKHDMPSLCRFMGTVSIPDLVQILQKSPNLCHIRVTLDIDNKTINDLIDAFKCTPKITRLEIIFENEGEILLFNNFAILNKPILPQLKELRIRYKGDYVHNAVSYFLNSIGTENLKTLSVGKQSDEIMRFKNLTSLSILEGNCISADVIEKLPKLVELTTQKKGLSIEEGMRLIKVLESSNRTLCLNKVHLRSYADLLEVDTCN